MPVSDDLSNEMPVEVSNEMPVDLHNEMPVDGLPRTNAENVEDRHVVNGDSYVSRAARTVSHEYPSGQERARFSENVMPQRPRTAFFTPSKMTMAKSVFEALENADIDATMFAKEDEWGGDGHIQVHFSEGEIPPTEFTAGQRRAFRFARRRQATNLPHDLRRSFRAVRSGHN